MRKLRRFIWYLAGRLLLITVLLGLFTVTFYYAMNASNIYIVLKDGMAKRAQVIMMGESPSDLTKFFQGSYLQRDENLLLAIDGRSPYSYYHHTRHRPQAGNDLDVVLAVGEHRARGIYRNHSPHRRTGEWRLCGGGACAVWRRL